MIGASSSSSSCRLAKFHNQYIYSFYSRAHGDLMQDSVNIKCWISRLLVCELHSAGKELRRRVPCVTRWRPTGKRLLPVLPRPLLHYIAVCFFNREQTVHILYFHSSWDCDEPQLIDSRNISITKVLSKLKMNFNCASKCWNLVDISTYFVRYISTICTNNYLCFY